MDEFFFEKIKGSNRNIFARMQLYFALKIIKFGQILTYFIVAINFFIQDLVLSEYLSQYEDSMGGGVMAKIFYSLILFSYLCMVGGLVYFSLLYKAVDSRATTAYYFITQFMG